MARDGRFSTKEIWAAWQLDCANSATRARKLVFERFTILLLMDPGKTFAEVVEALPAAAERLSAGRDAHEQESFTADLPRRLRMLEGKADLSELTTR